MKLMVKDLPKCIRSFSFSPKAVFSDKEGQKFLLEARYSVFGKNCIESAERIGIDPFDLVFVNDMPFCECFDSAVKKKDFADINTLRTAFMLKRMYIGDVVRVARIYIFDDIAYIKEPEYCGFIFVDGPRRKNKGEKNSDRNIPLNKRASIIYESVRMSALRYTMQKCMQYKEIIDHYNYRRFSCGLRLNTRPADISEINTAMSLHRDRLFADFSRDKTRINFSVLYAIAYGRYTINDLYSKNTAELIDREKQNEIADLTSDLLTIVYNGNGIEISGMLINMIVGFSKTDLPPVDLNDLNTILENYAAYYVIANLASICENLFRFDSERQSAMREYMNRHAFFNYWTIMDRLSLMKQYSTIVSYCYKLSMFDAELYRDDPEYQGSVQYSYDCALKFAEELKANG